MPHISVESGKVHYDLYGASVDTDRPWLIIFPGMAMPSSAYAAAGDLLADHFRVLVPNHRGITTSDAALPYWLTVKKVHRDTIRIMNELGIPSAHVAGESYGGILALSLADYYPERVGSLILVNSSLAGNRCFRLNPATVAEMGKENLRSSSMWVGVGKAIFSKKFQQAEPEAFDAWLEMMCQTPFPLRTALAQGLAAGLYHGKNLAKLTAAVTVAWSDLDHFVDPINSKKIHQRIPHSQLVELKGVGHHVAGEDPVQLANLVKAVTNTASH